MTDADGTTPSMTTAGVAKARVWRRMCGRHGDRVPGPGRPVAYGRLGSVVSAVASAWGSVLLIGVPAGTLIGTELDDYCRRRRATTDPPPGDPDLVAAGT